MSRWSGISSWRGYAQGLFKVTNRRNVFQNKTQFRVLALTRPEHYSGPDLSTGQSSEQASKYWFIGRILSKNMSHYNFLESPCDMSTTSDPHAATMLMYMHAKIILSAAGEKPEFEGGDVIIASIEPGGPEVIYGLQFMKFLRVDDKDGSQSDILKEDCAYFNSDDFDWADAVPLGSQSSGDGDATPQPCGPDEFCDQRVVASYYTPMNRTAADIRMIVIHATAGAGGTGKAQAVAQWMASNPTHKVRATEAYKASGKPLYQDKYEACHSGTCKEKGVPYQEKPTNSSAHYFVDQGGAVWEAVPPESRAWHGSNTNGYSIGIEHTGTSLDPDEWTETLYRTSAKLTAGLAVKFGIPVVHTTDYQGSGFIAHSDIPQENPHHDPGEYWDWDKYISYVNEAVASGDYTTGASPAVAVSPEPETPEAADEHSDRT